VRHVLPVLHPATKGWRSREDPPRPVDAAFAYIRAHAEVRDIVLSGGDPLMLSDRRIEYFLKNLRAIEHVEIIRIHTRMPSHLPERITRELCDMIQKYHPVYVNVHFNHPDELTPPAQDALRMLADAGCPLGGQTVLLKGVNDDPAVMKKLMLDLLRCHVRPYYLYQADAVAGAEHFRIPLAKGLEIIRALQGWTSGLAVPHFVIDAARSRSSRTTSRRLPSARSSSAVTRARRTESPATPRPQVVWLNGSCP
jgi:lysine 2,3-aminomutase